MLEELINCILKGSYLVLLALGDEKFDILIFLILGVLFVFAHNCSNDNDFLNNSDVNVSSETMSNLEHVYVLKLSK